MKGSLFPFPADWTREGFVYCPLQTERCPKKLPVVYALGESADSAQLYLPKLESAEKKGSAPFLLVGVGCDWDREMTPWKAPAAFRGQPDFGGEADSFIDELCRVIKPWVDSCFPACTDPAHTAVTGYSLGGLAALYSLYRTEIFGVCACLSGSLWYDGWMDFMDSRCLSAPSVYFSLGRAEEKSRHPLMKKIGDCTRQAQQILSAQTGREVPLVIHNGGHHTEVVQRKLQALLWIAEQTK